MLYDRHHCGQERAGIMGMHTTNCTGLGVYFHTYCLLGNQLQGGIQKLAKLAELNYQCVLQYSCACA